MDKISLTGTLLHLNDPRSNLNDVCFIDPQWLCAVMARVVTVKEVNPFISKEGMIMLN